jgi:ABC-type multidrug transport system ATPase subunit
VAGRLLPRRDPGGEAARLVFARLLLEKPNVLVLDEPTNHLDLESIEALVEGLKAFEGTVVLVSHDRWLVKELATRIVEIRPDEILDYPGTYEEYVHSLGDDHLDADVALARARKEKRERKKEEAGRKARAREEARTRELRDERRRERRKLESRSQEVTGRIGDLEARISEIEATFAEPGYFEDADPSEVTGLEAERSALRDELAELMDEWERLEGRLQELDGD